jgi:NADH-quinone oxidoreductase subunit C
MTAEQLKQALQALFPSPAFEEDGEWTTLTLEPNAWPEAAQRLRSTPGLEFDYLFCVTAVDWKTHFTMVYHLSSTQNRHTLVVKIKLDRNTPELASVSAIWRTAEFHEREAYDLMGIVFAGHPDLRRLFMTDDWQGWPLRKDYEDPINMIKL